MERGATYQEVADEFGFHDRGAAYRAVQGIRRENAVYSGSTQEIRQRELDELAQMRREAWDRILNPLPAISRTGRVVTREDGSEVADVSGIASMLALLVRVSERGVRLTGTERPRRSINLSGKTDTAMILEFLDSLNPGDLTAALEVRRGQWAAEGAAERSIPGVVEELAGRAAADPGRGVRRVWP